MKNLTYSLLLVAASLSAVMAQTEKGNFLVGSQVGNLSVGTQNGINTLSARLSPIVGYFIANRLVLGVGIPAYISRIRYDNNTGMRTYLSSQIGVTPFLRYYFETANPKFKPYVGASAGYVTTTVKQTSSSANQPGRLTADGFAYGFQLGLAYFVSNRVSFDASMNFADGDSGVSQSAYNNPNLGLSQPRLLTFNVGFQLFLGK